MKPAPRTIGSCATCIHARTRGADGRSVQPYAGTGTGFCAKPGASKPTFIAYTFPANMSNRGATCDVSSTLLRDQPMAVAYAFQPRIARNGRGDSGDIVHALTHEAGADGRGDAAPCIAYRIHGSDDRVKRAATATETCTALRARVSGGQENSSTTALAYQYKVRRLTPVEFERLQGFPDHYTLIEWPGRPRSGAALTEEVAYLMRHGFTPERAAILAHTPDGPRYAAVGNSMATPVIRWLGERLQIVSAITP